MRSGTIEDDAIRGPVNVQATLESGQTFLWTRMDDKMYASDTPKEAQPWYRTVQDRSVIDVRQTKAGLEWRGTEDVTPILRRRLGIDDDLDSILSTFPDEPILRAAVDRYRGMRLVQEPFFGTVISFILSAQMRIPRIHRLVTTLRREFGAEISVEGETHYQFPSPESLAATTEAELRDLGLGYRAPYVRRTAQMIADDDVDPQSVAEQPYEHARETLTQLVGVGEKVADCILLFSLGFDEPVPLDTWIRSAIETHFPEVRAGTYEETSAAIRKQFGPRPGYTQTYVFHHLRTGGESPVPSD